MSILLSCVLFTGDSDNNADNDIEKWETIVDGLENGSDVIAFEWTEKLLNESLKIENEITAGGWYEDFTPEKIGLGDYAFGVATDIILGALHKTKEAQEALNTAAKYDNIKSASAKDIDILRDCEQYGFLGDYIKLYTEAYDDLWTTGESNFKDKLIEENVNYTDLIIDVLGSSMKAGLEAVATKSVGPAKDLAVIGLNALLGFELFNIIEGVWKFSGDLLYGQSDMKKCDLTLFYLWWIRDTLYHEYFDACMDFDSNPSVENAQRLNTYSRFMYRVFAASEQYAAQINETYATAGKLNFEILHYIPGGIDPVLTLLAQKQSEENLKRRDDYLYKAYEAYADFCNNKIYHISLNLMGGKFLATEQFGFSQNPLMLSKIDSIDANIPSGTPVRDGYNFLGWSTEPNASSANPDYTPGYTYSNNTDLILYAVWEKVPAITYNANKGSGAPASHANTVGATTLSSKIPTRTGHTFLGWSENPNATTPTYKKGGTLPAEKEGNITLYAVWQPKSFNVIFDANGGKFEKAGTTRISKEKLYNQAFVIDVEAPVRDGGYRFSGKWQHVDGTTGKVEIYDHDPTINLYDIGDNTTNDKVLKAIWDYRVLYDYNYGPGTNGYKKTENVSIESPTYTVGNTEFNEGLFKGWMVQDPKGEYWWTDGNYNNGKVSIIQPGETIELTKHLELYAKWDYYVHYYSSDTISHEAVRDGKDYAIDAPVNTVEGQVFDYWKTVDENGKEIHYKVGDIIDLTSDLDLHAVWKSESLNQVTLSAVTDKTSYEPGDTVRINILADNSSFFRVNTSGNNGFKLKAADGSKSTNAVYVEKSSVSKANELKCYDNGDSYTVELYLPANCPNGKYPIEISVSNGTYDVSLNGSVDGTESSTATETLIIKIGTEKEETTTYVLSYDLNGGYGTIPKSEYFKENGYVSLSNDDGFGRDGFKFKGWSKDPEGDGKTYKAGKEYQFGESVHLYAVWEPVKNDGALLLDLQVERFSEVYKPGETACIFVGSNYSNHFFFDVRECKGFTIKNAMGNQVTNGTWFEFSSPNYESGNEGYWNGGKIPIYINIPENCRDGQYTFYVTASNGILNSDNNSNGDKLKKSVTIYVRESDDADSISLSRTEMTLHAGAEKRLEAVVEPAHIFNHYNKKTVSWETSDQRIASIDEKGNEVDITGLMNGSATITAYVDGVSASCQVTVVSCDYSEKIIDEEYLAHQATCAEQATYYYVCSCGNVGSETYKVGALEKHDFCDWEITVEPGEYNAGLKERYCSGCGAAESETLPAVGHTHNYEAEVTEPTCEEQGYTTHTCWGCGDSYEDSYTDALGHQFGEWEVVQEATEYEVGWLQRVCNMCGEIEDEEIPMLEHTHNYESEVTEPTCTEQGYTTHTCWGCGDSYEDSYTDALGHQFGEWEVVQEATEYEVGWKERTCEVCGETEDEEIPMLDHTHNYEAEVTEPTCEEQGYTTHTCLGCGDSYEDSYTDALGHQLGEWYVTIEPTTEAEGEECRDCGRCGHYEVRPIPILSIAQFGDLNGDGAADNLDAMLILQYVVGLVDGAKLNLSAADVNADGDVDNLDAMLILQYTVGMIDKFPAAK